MSSGPAASSDAEAARSEGASPSVAASGASSVEVPPSAEDEGSTAERHDYRRAVAVDAKPGAAVRVVAEDEADGREVRTLILAGRR